MTSAAEVIHEASLAGVILAADLGNIIAQPASRLTPELRQAIRHHKGEVIRSLVLDRYGLTLAEIQDTAGPDWPEVETDPALFETVARSVVARRMRERGEVPAHYTAKTVCKHCGPVPIFEGTPERVEGCPWCFNRAAGQSVTNHG